MPGTFMGMKWMFGAFIVTCCTSATRSTTAVPVRQGHLTRARHTAISGCERQSRATVLLVLDSRIDEVNIGEFLVCRGGGGERERERACLQSVALRTHIYVGVCAWVKVPPPHHLIQGILHRGGVHPSLGGAEEELL
jgi:hypothetical protein